MATFRISGWYVPPADENIFRLIKEAGLNHIFIDGDEIGNGCKDISLAERYLCLCDTVGLEAYVQKGNDVSVQELVEKADVLRRHKSFCGVLVFDEPAADMFGELGEERSRFFHGGALGDFFVNLYPSYARSECIIYSYSAYVRSFAETLVRSGGTKDWLSFDHYPLMYEQDHTFGLSDHWLSDTQTVAETGKAFGLRTNAFVQTMPFSANGDAFGSRDRIPSPADLRLQAYTYLAFGFAGITYFCVGTPIPNFEFLERHYAMFDRSGRPTPLYDAVKGLNGEINCFAHEYAAMKREGTYLIRKEESAPTRCFADQKPFSSTERIRSVSADGNVLFGHFSENGCEALVPVNFGETTRERIKLCSVRFNGRRTYTLWRRGICTRGQEEELTIRLEPGEGVFIRIG